MIDGLQSGAKFEEKKGFLSWEQGRMSYYSFIAHAWMRFPSGCQWDRLACKQAEFVFFGLTDGGRQAAAEHGCTAGVGILGLVRNRLWCECFPSSRWEGTSDTGHKSVPAWYSFLSSSDYIVKMERSSFKKYAARTVLRVRCGTRRSCKERLARFKQNWGRCTRMCIPDVPNKCVLYSAAGRCQFVAGGAER